MKNARKDVRNRTIGDLYSAPLGSGGEGAQPLPRVRSGSVMAMEQSYSHAERENEELRARLAQGAAVLEIDPGAIDPSPVRDRLDDGDDARFQELKASIEQRGQEVPVLVRVHPGDPARYQSAYGHRRIRACGELGRPVKALVREMDDEQLVVAQGLENSARQDLTFIERANFARRLEQAGYARAVIREALAVDKGEVSKMLAVCKDVSRSVIEAIGRAPKVGRERWLVLGKRLQDAAALGRVEALAASSDFAGLPTDERFSRSLAAANERAQPPERGRVRPVISPDGAEIARVAEHGSRVRLTLDRRSLKEGFDAFLIDQLPALYARFSGAGQGGEDRGGD